MHYKKKIIGIIDYGCGNLTSIHRATIKQNIPSEIISEYSKLKFYSHLIIPGVGSFPNAIKSLKERGFYNEIIEHKKKNKPILGICLGMQLFMQHGFEKEPTKGFGFFDGDVISLQSISQNNKYKIPNIGWYKISKNTGSFEKNTLIQNNENKFYFIHSYFCDVKNKSDCYYFVKFDNKNIPCIIKKENIIGIQFHPEKSREPGLKIFNYFFTL